MGNWTCTAACAASDRRYDDQLGRHLTPAEVKDVQETWGILSKDLVSLGVTVFLNFFETEPDLKMMFPKIIRLNEVSQLEWYVDRDMLQRHAVTVMEALGAAVESLEDSHFLNNVLIALGQTHAKRNMKAVTLKRLWPSLEVGLSSMLGERYSAETAEAWRKLYNYICLQMKRGMDNPELPLDISDSNHCDS
ncbi:neuroglobin-like [Babylonia areolata]|uniref:neuroglobin-like n=1 Tax=Babylonia areolata TaxID=304850 RepID=UPI003FD60408